MKHFFIMNPAAGKGTKFHELIDDIHKVCDRRGVSYEIHVTEKIGEATEFVRDTCASSDEQLRFYAVGGDGTINEVASGLVGAPNAELAVIPMGTGNDFVKNFENVDQFFDIDAQLDGETMDIDLIKWNDRYAVNLINIGFDCEIAKQAALNRRSVFIPSKLAYTAGIVQKITQLGTALVHGRVYLDGVPHKGSKHQICVFANGQFYGGGYHSAPAASIDDGIIDCCVVRKVTLGELLQLIGPYKEGTHLTKKDVPQVFVYKKCERVDLVFDHPTDICVDGEIERVKNGLTLTVAHKAVKLSKPKACQIIPADPAVLRAARRYGKR
ncbi:MAG: YegS/Rv2252/BmrU family lipid kinase [Clostridia bacterium]|nr:YegS/Rv2252/BmrU family lipid kinase [Clostridia bacterium]